ncbi:peptidase a4 family protein [Hirsutella rhossiliensis]|uniref:Peptidase a4 family domain-containing protein n=1 Tax=Hirsutella rhossiliensis TaxID=111463 RepID=A0A9P8MSA9_9HYPO|nr:peptidase a4 family domain-containing protein [Hirsutella rhossiliensis]KAH0959549.1 peptidase a4 family domain-containing protein [Hirsutella rhossiliensis]
MKYATTLAAVFGVAAALPGPSEVREARRATRRDATRVPKGPGFNMRNNSYPQYSNNWAGAVQIGNGFNKVEGTVTVPQVSGDATAAAAAWVGIDGDTCQSAILQTGVSFYGDGSFDSWYEWIPDYSHSFTGFDISVGDQIKMSVDASSMTGGVAVLENLSNGQKVSHTFTNSPSSLCETNAEWIVEDFQSSGQLVPLVDFGTVTFTDASASGSGGTVTPDGATIIDIKDQSGNVLTNCDTSGNDVVCQYTGS